MILGRLGDCLPAATTSLEGDSSTAAEGDGGTVSSPCLSISSSC